MYGRLVEVDGLEPSKLDEVMSVIRDRVIAGMKERDGFGGFISLFDDGSRRMRNVVLWESRESAEEAEREWASMRDELVRGFGATVRSADLYEAPIVEIQAGVRA